METEGAFRKALNTIGQRHLPVIVNSGGGEVIAGFAIGRMIRARRLDVVAGKRTYLREMGISGELQKLMGQTDPKSVHWLTHPERVMTVLVTDYIGAESVIARTQGDLIGPELPVTSISWGSFNQPGFGTQPAKVLLEFIHRKDSPVVEVNALIDNREDFPTYSQLGLVLQIGLLKNSTEYVATSNKADSPLAATLAVPQFCEAVKINRTLTLKLQGRNRNAIADLVFKGQPGYFAADKLPFMPDLILDTCKSVSTAAK